MFLHFCVLQILSLHWLGQWLHRSDKVYVPDYQCQLLECNLHDRPEAVAWTVFNKILSGWQVCWVVHINQQYTDQLCLNVKVLIWLNMQLSQIIHPHKNDLAVQHEPVGVLVRVPRLLCLVSTLWSVWSYYSLTKIMKWIQQNFCGLYKPSCWVMCILWTPLIHTLRMFGLKLCD